MTTEKMSYDEQLLEKAGSSAHWALRQKHKEWLEKEIEYLANCSLFAELKPEDKTELKCYELEYKAIIAEEIAQQKEAKKEISKEMRNRRRRGKYGEKKLAKEVGGRRDGGIGRKDVVAGMFSFEVKTIKKIPASIVKLMSQAERLKKKDTIAVGVFRCNSPRQEYFIVERQDWLNLHGR